MQGCSGSGHLGSSSPSDAEKALAEGIAAVVRAMAGEVSFADQSEVAFAALRRGCRHCASRGSNTLGLADLRRVSQEDRAAVVAFLARVSSRRTSWRRVQELGAILASSSWCWYELLATTPPLGGPRGLLCDELYEAREILEATLGASASCSSSECYCLLCLETTAALPQCRCSPHYRQQQEN
eukprot:TRINITY_DN20909_c0_g1_i2.p1 TRINITY_DN20909_c0_g1~~TRINITY_DN20909_c0_g1_i2.p1  ORF type:complete len:183 (+),score=31.50 TRINITY_DN20909_c0_g1_i2:94-642(+)